MLRSFGWKKKLASLILFYSYYRKTLEDKVNTNVFIFLITLVSPPWRIHPIPRPGYVRAHVSEIHKHFNIQQAQSACLRINYTFEIRVNWSKRWLQVRVLQRVDSFIFYTFPIIIKHALLAVASIYFYPALIPDRLAYADQNNSIQSTTWLTTGLKIRSMVRTFSMREFSLIAIDAAMENEPVERVEGFSNDRGDLVVGKRGMVLLTSFYRPLLFSFRFDDYLKSKFLSIRNLKKNVIYEVLLSRNYCETRKRNNHLLSKFTHSSCYEGNNWNYLLCFFCLVTLWVPKSDVRTLSVVVEISLVSM